MNFFIKQLAFAGKYLSLCFQIEFYEIFSEFYRKIIRQLFSERNNLFLPFLFLKYFPRFKRRFVQRSGRYRMEIYSHMGGRQCGV